MELTLVQLKEVSSKTTLLVLKLTNVLNSINRKLDAKTISILEGGCDFLFQEILKVQGAIESNGEYEWIQKRLRYIEEEIININK